MPTKSEEIKIREKFLKIQLVNLKKRYERQLKRDEFIKRHKASILALDTNGWPRLKQMADRNKWLNLVYKAKIEGVYGIGTANCDVIAQLSRFAKELNKTK